MRILQLPPSDLARFAEIDRSEHVTTIYRMHNGQLEAQAVDHQVPNWTREDPSGFGVTAHIEHAASALESGGVLLGALDGTTLAGLAVLRYRLVADMAQLVQLYISQPYRRRGVATALFEEVCQLARADGARQLYISATPSGSALGFYRRHGATPIATPHPELFALEPEDIHLVKQL